ncbi:MAG: peptidoglycan DD-metalloendopeptidase family protein [Alphaproteobacteria bacterium]|nr:peptidoglycan DD-metalloendopeptidase family protein [Alphaproteobacteria bacterium]
MAQGPSPSTRTEALSALDRVQEAITLSAERTGQLRAEVEALGTDRNRLSAELIATGRRVQAVEIEAAEVAGRLTELRAAEQTILDQLGTRDSEINGILGALQRLGQNPPPALIIRPGEALDSARSAMLLSAVLPQLREQADTIIAELGQLEVVRREVLSQEAGLQANIATLNEEQVRIAALIEARRRGVVRAEADLVTEQRQSEILAANATSLDQLIKVIAGNESIAAVDPDTALAADATAATVSMLAPETIRLAFNNMERQEPAVPITSARGYLTLPVSGVRITDFDGADGFGGTSRGISIVTRAEAPVLAPADGWVIYSGPFLGFEQIVILDAGLGYTILLAGMDTTDVELRQFVLMGEPIGRMGSRTSGQTVATSAGMSRPTLYIEMRALATPIDPAEWWAEVQGTTQRG